MAMMKDRLRGILDNRIRATAVRVMKTPLPQSLQKPTQTLNRVTQKVENSLLGVPARVVKGRAGEQARLLSSSINDFTQGRPIQGTLKGLGFGLSLTPPGLVASAVSGGIGALSAPPGQRAEGFGAGTTYGSIYGKAGKLTDPFVSKTLGRLVPGSGILASRVAPSVANAAQGIGFDRLSGKQTTPTSIGIDLVTGAVGGRGMFSPSVRGVKAVKPRMEMKGNDASEMVNMYKAIEGMTANERVSDKLGLAKNFNDTAAHYLKKLGYKTRQIARMTESEKWRILAPHVQENVLYKIGDVPVMGIGGGSAAKVNLTKATSGTQNRSMEVQDVVAGPKTYTAQQEPSRRFQEISSNKIIPRNKVPTREQVKADIERRISDFMEETAGYRTDQPRAVGTKQASAYTRLLRKGQERFTTSVEAGLASQNPLVRNAASTLQNFFRGVGMSPERARASMELKGGIQAANDRAYNVMDSLYKLVGSDRKSLERINAVLDPSIAKTKLKLEDLSDTEKEVYALIRKGLDLVHDISYANGHISKDLYVKNKNRYTPRLYRVMEIPPEVNDFLYQGKKIDNNLYLQRKDIDEWKIENSLNDPVYALGKRLAQVETNSAIKKYTDFLSSNKNLVSDVERPGFTKLSDSPAYGSLSGKWVLNSAAEDLKGFFFSNAVMQNLYDVFRAYDRMGIRQLQKKMLTVFNPTTNVGNIISDNVFGFMIGVDPLTLNKNIIELSKDRKTLKQLNDYLIRAGINSTDITRTDFINKLGSIDELALMKKPGRVKLISNKITEFYGKVDDVYKVAGFKSLLDKGYSLDEAVRLVSDGFQNYASVGKFYDLFSKTPVVGKPFIKFQGDLIRIMKNAAVNRPLHLITFLATLWSVSRLASKLSGETDEDRKTRENRFSAPMIPGLNIPLTWQTPIGEINVARYISPFFVNNETSSITGNMLPFYPEIQKGKDFASNFSLNVNDPLVGPFIQLMANRDFRGKSISDPNETKYKPSNLTPLEKLTNQAVWLGRSYTPPLVNSLIDLASVSTGGKDMYGRTQTVPQAIARLGGVKITQFGPKEAEEYRQKEAELAGYTNESIEKRIRSVEKQLLKGEISEEQAKKRIKALEKQKVDVVPTSSTDKYQYIDNEGNLKTINLDKVLSMPEDSAMNRGKKDREKWKLAGEILTSNLAPNLKVQALKKIGVDEEQAEYYNIAKEPNDIKYLYVEEEIGKILSTSKDRQAMLQFLAEQRKSVGGKMILTNGVIDDLRKAGYITKAEADKLKAIGYESGKVPVVKVSGRGGGAVLKSVKLTVPKMGEIRARIPSLARTKITPPTAKDPFGIKQFNPQSVINQFAKQAQASREAVARIKPVTKESFNL